MRVTSDAAVLKVKAALLLILSEVLLPLSVAKDAVGVAIVLSRVKVKAALVAVLVAASTCLTKTLLAPSPVRVKLEPVKTIQVAPESSE